MKGRAIAYSAEEMAWLEDNRLMVISEYHAAFAERFGRDDVSLINLHSLRKRKGWKTGRTGQWVKGEEPHNKGKPFPSRGRSAQTQFKKGQQPHNTNYLGHERINASDGYVYISVAETNPHTGYERRYVLKHLWLWEQANGPVPEGHCLKSRDGDRSNTDPANWQCIPRAILPRLAGGNRYHRVLAYDDAPDELKPTIMATAKLVHALKVRTA